MSICGCCLPTPITCLIIATIFTFLGIFDLTRAYENSRHASDDELTIQCLLASFHCLQVMAGVSIVVAVLWLLPWLLRGSAIVVGVSGLVYLVRVVFVESRTEPWMVVLASLVMAIYIYFASLLCVSSDFMELMQSDEQAVVWYAPFIPSGASPSDPEAQGAPGGRPGPYGPIHWFVFVPPPRFPPPPPPSTTPNQDSTPAAQAAGPATNGV